MSCRKSPEIDDSAMMAEIKWFLRASSISNPHMILHNWNSVIDEVAFTFETMYICRISCLKLHFGDF